jgi:phage anti-repressor protein
VGLLSNISSPSTWIKDRIGSYEFVENIDYVVSDSFGENPLGGRPTKDYHLTLDMDQGPRGLPPFG